jgi:DNA-binding Lrp family transcriptional regulator
MADKAYVLIETVMGRSREVTLELQKCEWVESIERVAGPYDIVAIARGQMTGEAEQAIRDELSAVAGVIRVVVCPISAGAKPTVPVSLVLVG